MVSIIALDFISDIISRLDRLFELLSEAVDKVVRYAEITFEMSNNYKSFFIDYVDGFVSFFAESPEMLGYIYSFGALVIAGLTIKWLT